MRPSSQPRSLLIRLLPPLLIPAAFIAGTLAVTAQQSPPDATAGSSPQAVPVAPDAPVTPEDIGDALLVKRRYQEALESYRKMPGRSADLWNKMGIALQMLFDPKDAARCYKESLRLSPAHAWALNNLATIYDARGDFAKAEAFYRKAQEADPESARIAMNLGTNLMAQRKYTQGSEMYKLALALDPEVLNSSEGPVSIDGVPLEQRGAMNYYKAKNYAQAGMFDSAITFLKRAMNEGFTSPTDIVRDSGFDRLRGNPAFKRLIAEHIDQPVSAPPSPASDDPTAEPQAQSQ
jgi:tetratricopeptide (TPR) repeat protein